jgi:hypothetical protein
VSNLPPIQSGEIYIRCPECLTIGWTEDDDSEPMPDCPPCGVPAEKWQPGDEGTPDVRLIDGDPVDAAHHLTAEVQP